MVGNVTSLTNNGLRDWIIQRATAVIIGAFTITLLAIVITNAPLTFATWKSAFHCRFMKVFTVLTLISVVFHTWIGIWTVTTDYLKPVCMRLCVQIIVATFLLGAGVWALAILWSV